MTAKLGQRFFLLLNTLMHLYKNKLPSYRAIKLAGGSFTGRNDTSLANANFVTHVTLISGAEGLHIYSPLLCKLVITQHHIIILKS